MPSEKHVRRFGALTLRRALPLLSLVLLGSAACGPGRAADTADPALAGDLLITNVHVVPMDRERVLRNQALLVRGDAIAWLGPAREASRVRAARTIDGGGAYVVPGLVDMHVHVRDEDELTLYLLNGVTTLVNLSGDPEHLEMRGRLRAGELPGPTLYTAGPTIDGDPPRNPGFTPVASAERAREVVAEQHARGYDLVKIYDLIGPEPYRAAAEKARSLGRPVVGHIPKAVGLEGVLGGHDVVAHAEEYFYTFFKNEDDASRLAEAARLTATGRLSVIPNTAFIHSIIAQAEDLAAVLRWPEVRYLSPVVLPSWLPETNRYVGRPADWLARNKRMYPFLLKLTRALHEAGVPLFTGTDASAPGAVPGFSLHREIADLVAAGLTPFEALRAATAAPGEWLTRLGRDTPAGQVAAGRRADLLLVQRNPLEDVAALRTLDGLVVRGRWIDLAELRARLDARAAQTGRLLEWYEAFKREVERGTLAEAEALVRSAPSAVFAEGVVNALGYSYLQRSRDTAKAVAVFEINARVFPRSFNAWDSLGEGLAEAGERDRAIESYRKSLALNPDNDNARRVIETLQRPR